eukprot:5077299-Pyramimonas_sp.AAC.1
MAVISFVRSLFASSRPALFQPAVSPLFGSRVEGPQPPHVCHECEGRYVEGGEEADCTRSDRLACDVEGWPVGDM